ncbi:hypothetical protein IWQ56_007022, partial [Coemansia nantahalensis]
MQFAKTVLVIAAIATSAFAVDWTSPAATKCIKENWAGIKAKADPVLPMAGAVLTPAQKAKLDSLLAGEKTLPANPSD